MKAPHIKQLVEYLPNPYGSGKIKLRMWGSKGHPFPDISEEDRRHALQQVKEGFHSGQLVGFRGDMGWWELKKK